MAKKELRQRVLAMERFHLSAYHVQMILDLKISFDSLAKRQARAWDNNRWTLAQYLGHRYAAYPAMAQVKDGTIVLAFCWAHVRRDFLAVARSWPDQEMRALGW